MFWKTIKNFLANLSTSQLVFLPILISVLPILALELISHGHYSDEPKQNIMLYLMFFFWGLAGIPMILRKEAPGIISFRGWLAVAQGVLLLAGSWSLILILVILKKGGSQ